MALRFAVVPILGLLLGIGPVMGQSKPSVAVMDFSDSKVKSHIEDNVGVGQDLGQEISQMLQSQLVDGSSYRVLNRQALDRITKEQNFSNSDRFDPVASAKLAALAGVDVIIIGEVTISGVGDKGTAVRAPDSSVDTYRTASIEIRARLVEAKTGEVLASAIGVGTASSLKEASIKLAVKAAVTQLAAKLNKEAPSVLDGQIADVSGGEVILNVGSDQSLKVGDTVSVLRAKPEIRDPATGPVTRHSESELGTVKITSVDPRSATGTFSGGVNPKVGDSLRWLYLPGPVEAPAVRPTAPSKQPDDKNAAQPVAPQSPAPAPPAPAPESPSPSQVPTSPSRSPASPSPPQSFPSAPSSAPSPADEYTQGNQLEAWKKTLKAGAVEYRVPGEMTASVPATVTVNLHGYQDLQTRTLPEATGTGSLQVSSYMKVELFAPLDPGEFTITQSSGEVVQFIPNDGYATWMWSVTPSHAAPSEMLQIRISLVHKDGTTAVEQILEEKTYNVTVNVEKLSVTLKQSFWKDPIAWFKYMLPGGAGWGAAAALFAWVGGLAWWKNRKTKSKRATKRSNE